MVGRLVSEVTGLEALVFESRKSLHVAKFFSFLSRWCQVAGGEIFFGSFVCKFAILVAGTRLPASTTLPLKLTAALYVREIQMFRRGVRLKGFFQAFCVGAGI